MGFTQSAFIRKNTPELRKKLKELGYVDNRFIPIKNPEYLITVLYKDGSCYFMDISDKDELVTWVLSNKIDGYNNTNCGTNEALFLAIAALRDDSDYMQWFICDRDYIDACELETDAKGSFREWFEIHKKYKHLYHKATIEELKEHFKEEEK